MSTPLAWKNLSHNRVRTCVGVAGVGFAVILMFMEMGFKGGVASTATQIYDALDFDLMLRSPAYLHLTEPRSFSRMRVFQAASLPEVKCARPFYLGLSEWQAPIDYARPVEYDDRHPDDPEGQWRAIITMGTQPENAAFLSDAISDAARQLTDPRFVLVDVKSKPEYGPVQGRKFSEADIGVETTLGPSRVRIVGLFELGTGMASNGACLTSPEGFVRACPWQMIDDVNFGLIKLYDPSQVDVVKAKLQEIYGLPSVATDSPEYSQLEPVDLTNTDVEILTRETVNAREKHRWVSETPLGQIFTMGVWVALSVGIAIVYQVLSTDIQNMMSEYATLKAIGYNNKFLTKVVLQQSVLLALVGYVPSLVVSWILYHVVEAASGMPMSMTKSIMAAVLVLTVAMCVVSGLAALRKLFQADPVDLF